MAGVAEDVRLLLDTGHRPFDVDVVLLDRLVEIPLLGAERGERRAHRAELLLPLNATVVCAAKR